MENYNELKLTNEKNVISRTFSYDFNKGIFSFENKYKEIDEDLNLLFSPHFSSLPDLKSRLENEIFLLQNQNGEFSFEINYYSKEYGLRYYLVKGNNLADSNVVLGVIYDVTYEYDLLEKLAKTMNEQPPIKKKSFWG